MHEFMRKLWRDEAGSMGVEWAFVATILVLGAVTGLVASKQMALAELQAPPVKLAR